MNDRFVTFGGRVLPVIEVEFEDESSWILPVLERWGDRKYRVKQPDWADVLPIEPNRF